MVASFIETPEVVKRVQDIVQEFGKQPWRCADFKSAIAAPAERAGFAARLEPLDS